MLKPVVLPDVPTSGALSGLDPLDGRYYDPDVARYVSEQTRVVYQAHIEAALAHTLADEGICTRKQADAIERASRAVSAQEVYEEESITKHDIKALVNCIKRKAGPSAAPYVHFGATSYDIVATASAAQMRDTMHGVIIPRLHALLTILIGLTETYAHTLQVGRTHGQHAVPITFGFAISEYVSRLGDSMMAIHDLSGMLRGKFSGAVGAYNALSLFVSDPLAFEKVVLAKVGLQPAPFSTQIVPPEAMVRLLDELTIAAGIMANLAHDMRHLQRSEIGEVREKFEKGQTGSSTMAHKRNPWNFENVVSMSKQVIAQSVNANLNLSSEHQRDLTDSASARFYAIPVACVANMAARLNRIMGNIEVDAAAMDRNLRLSGGAIAAEPFYLLLAKHGHPEAHETSKRLAHEALQKGLRLHEVIAKDTEGASYWRKFTAAERAIIQDPETHYSGLAAKKALKIAKQWRKVVP